MNVKISNATGKDYRAIMAVEAHIKNKGKTSLADRNPERSQSRWLSAELQTGYRGQLGAGMPKELVGQIRVAKDEKGSIMGYCSVFGEKGSEYYGFQFSEPGLPAIDDVNAKRPGRFMLSFRKDAPADAIAMLVSRIMEDAKNHPEISHLWSYVPESIAEIVRKSGILNAKESDGIHICEITFQGKKCTPREATITLHGDQVPDTVENRGHRRGELGSMALDAAYNFQMTHTEEEIRELRLGL